MAELAEGTPALTSWPRGLASQVGKAGSVCEPRARSQRHFPRSGPHCCPPALQQHPSLAGLGVGVAVGTHLPSQHPHHAAARGLGRASPGTRPQRSSWSQLLLLRPPQQWPPRPLLSREATAWLAAESKHHAQGPLGPAELPRRALQSRWEVCLRRTDEPYRVPGPGPGLVTAAGLLDHCVPEGRPEPAAIFSPGDGHERLLLRQASSGHHLQDTPPGTQPAEDAQPHSTT